MKRPNIHSTFSRESLSALEGSRARSITINLFQRLFSGSGFLRSAVSCLRRHHSFIFSTLLMARVVPIPIFNTLFNTDLFASLFIVNFYSHHCSFFRRFRRPPEAFCSCAKIISSCTMKGEGSVGRVWNARHIKHIRVPEFKI